MGTARTIAQAAEQDARPRSTAPPPARLQRFGRLDILVDNAGRTLNEPFLDTSLEHWDAIVSVLSVAAAVAMKEPSA